MEGDRGGISPGGGRSPPEDKKSQLANKTPETTDTKVVYSGTVGPRGGGGGEAEEEKCLDKASGAVMRGIGGFFRWYGEQVAARPCLFIGLCVVLTGVCGAGLVKFRAENEGIKLWIPYNSDYR